MSDTESDSECSQRLAELLLQGANRYKVDLTADETAELQEMVEPKGVSRRVSFMLPAAAYKSAVIRRSPAASRDST